MKILKIRSVLLAFVFLGVLGAQGCCFSELELEEAGYRNNIDELDEAIEATSGDTEAALEKARKRYKKAYEELPAAESERTVALEELNKGMDAKLAEFTGDISEARRAQETKAEAERDRWLDEHAGDWRDNPNIDGKYTMRVHIWNGRLEYRRADKNGTSRNITAPITRTSPTSFSAGALGVETTFTIDSPPEEIDGVWKMTIDGKTLVRVDL